ncbi:uncharacterized protein EV420DRAFT_1482695 [Desarmillaria tabescens]|uniref:Uncharacterized protein n=1 Tax=Armillaria tabescens TaxID=1929756 RepID=A0AA39JXD4_ARMTA|nr:uncharacterized protein EV420DRAFT_1482695 [Desarmillaria tabescens]KAK0450488.1 hypothetical protein EV420DRAFT_1482695 [Desarmillaria tabescens]
MPSVILSQFTAPLSSAITLRTWCTCLHRPLQQTSYPPPSCRPSMPVSKFPASGTPYIEKLAKVVVVVMEFLELRMPQRGKNKKDIKELCEGIANTVVVINTMLKSSAQNLKRKTEGKHSGIEGFFNTKESRDAIQDYRIRVDNLKTNFLGLSCVMLSGRRYSDNDILQIHVMGNCLLVLVELRHTQRDLMHPMAKVRIIEDAAPNDS